VPDQRKGFLFGLGAYLLWGLFPLYWKLLDDSGAVELLSHRILWSMVTIAGLVVIRRRLKQLRATATNRRQLVWLALAAVLITFNWGTYIWGVNHGHIVETSLGYFITPLFTVMLGVVVLGERLRPAQWAALGIAALAVLGLTLEYGRPPWVALILTVSFGTYGLAKKKAGAGALEGMTVETGLIAPIALAVLIVLTARGAATVPEQGFWYVALMIAAGPVTAAPLLLFGAAATRIPLTTLGILQYIAPIMQFALGVLVYNEAMPPMRWAGFGLVWLALVIMTWDALSYRRRTLALAATAPAPA
jgi:chloramphenicol-sensitive protein RarD